MHQSVARLNSLSCNPEGQEVYKRPNQKITSFFAQLPKRSKTAETVSDVGALTAAAGQTATATEAQDGLQSPVGGTASMDVQH